MSSRDSRVTTNSERVEPFIVTRRPPRASNDRLLPPKPTVLHNVSARFSAILRYPAINFADFRGEKSNDGWLRRRKLSCSCSIKLCGLRRRFAVGTTYVVFWQKNRYTVLQSNWSGVAPDAPVSQSSDWVPCPCQLVYKQHSGLIVVSPPPWAYLLKLYFQALRNWQVPIQLTQCNFPWLAISNAIG